MKPGTLMQKVKNVIKKLLKNGGHCARFDVTILTNTAILEKKLRVVQN